MKHINCVLFLFFPVVLFLGLNACGQSDQGVEYQYLVDLPVDYDEEESKTWPLMIFLHGIGERGSDLELVRKHGPPKLTNQGKQFPFILVSPQCPDNRLWDAKSLSRMLDHLEQQMHIDQDKIYLTGLSTGGHGTWGWAIEEPERFAAIAPICGVGDPLKADAIKELPIWVFHGAKDNVVPITGSSNMVDALKEKGSKVKFTVYPDTGHDSWTDTYDNPALYDWFLNQRRKN
jgi:predicted peptidase